MQHRVVDLNCDLGEGMHNDASIMPFISSANIACGYHAGDLETMHQTIALCIQYGVAIGAHPSFPDRENFGRKEMDMGQELIAHHVLVQLETIQNICSEMGVKLHHVKPHGALYNMSARNPAIATAIAKTVFQFNPTLRLFGLAGSCSIQAAEEAGLEVVHEFFADRTYQADGSLTPRSQVGALIEENELARKQAMLIATEGAVIATDGTRIKPAGTNANVSICLHGDGDHALVFARLIHQSLEESGFIIQAF